MSDSAPSIITRFFMAIAVFFRLLFDAAFAARVRSTALAPDAGPEAPSTPEPLPEAPTAPPPAREQGSAQAPDAALTLLSLLQREGRLLDFLHEDVAGYSDADIGAAARVVHDECKKALASCVTLEPIRSEEEGARVTLEAGFSAAEVRLTGQVVGEPPFTGQLAHRGWRACRVELPQLTDGHDARVLAPAEVEL